MGCLKGLDDVSIISNNNKINYFIVVLDFSTAVTLDFFSQHWVAFWFYSCLRIFSALWCARTPRCILHVSGKYYSCIYLQGTRVTRTVTVSLSCYTRCNTSFRLQDIVRMVFQKFRHFRLQDIVWILVSKMRGYLPAKRRAPTFLKKSSDLKLGDKSSFLCLCRRTFLLGLVPCDLQ